MLAALNAARRDSSRAVIVEREVRWAGRFDQSRTQAAFATLQRQRFQSGHTETRLAKRHSQRTRKREPNADARKRTRASRHNDAVDLGECNACALCNLARHRRQTLCLAA